MKFTEVSHYGGYEEPMNIAPVEYDDCCNNSMAEGDFDTLKKSVKKSQELAKRREAAYKIARHNAIVDGLPIAHEASDYIFEI